MSDQDKQIVNDAAATLFWTLAQRTSVAATQDSVLATQGHCLFSQDGWRDLLAGYGYDQLAPALQELFRREIRAEAVDFTKREQNLVGMVYAEDAAEGRSPSAASVDCRAVDRRPQAVRGRERLEQIGALCLRTPLPAVAFADRIPSQSFIAVSDTRMAFGFQLPLFLAVLGCQTIAPGLVLLTGIFHIPVPSVEAGQRWTTIIPNATHFINRLHISTGRGSVPLEVIW